MGILRNEPPEFCAERDEAELAFPPAPSGTPVAPASAGTDTPNKPLPVAARNSRRSMFGNLRGVFMRSPQPSSRGCRTREAGGHYTTLFARRSYVIRCGLSASRGGIDEGTVKTRSERGF